MSDLDKELHDLFHRASRQVGVGSRGKECLSELTVCQFLERKINHKEQERVEKHLLECDECLHLMAEASKAKSAFEKGQLKSRSGERWFAGLRKELPAGKRSTPRRKTGLWLVAAVIFFSCSFLFHRYFIQFSVATLLLGIKWIVETRSTKILVAIQEAYQRGDRQTAEELLEKLGKRK